MTAEQIAKESTTDRLHDLIAEAERCRDHYSYLMSVWVAELEYRNNKQEERAK